MADEDSVLNPAKRIKLNDKDSADETGDNLAIDDRKNKPHGNSDINDVAKGTNENGIANQEHNPDPEDVDAAENDDSADDEDDNASDISSISGLSELSGEETWAAKPAGSISWVYRCMSDGVDPRELLGKLMPRGSSLAEELDEITMWKLIVSIVSEPPPRQRLDMYTTLEHAQELLCHCNKIMVLTGAGVSVSCGIPDFRSKNGIYARLAVDFPDLPDPQAMFDIRYFKQEKRPFFKFAKEIFPGQFEPSTCHKFLKLLEDQGKLLRNYTQNIDTLEQVAGIKNVVQCHGSFATATCMACKFRCLGEDIKEDIMNQVVPLCKKCDPQTPMSILKPDIVFFGESLPEHFHEQMRQDKEECDLLIVIGSSLKVRPVALVPTSLPANVPQILINKERLRNQNFDIELLGDCDLIVGELCRRLGEKWASLARQEPMTQIDRSTIATPPVSSPSSPGREESLTEPERKNVISESVRTENRTVAKEEKGSADNNERNGEKHICTESKDLPKSGQECDDSGNKSNDPVSLITETSSAVEGDHITKKFQSSPETQTAVESSSLCNKLNTETSGSHNVDTAESKSDLGSETVSEKPLETCSVSDTQVPGSSKDSFDGLKKMKNKIPVYSCNIADLLKGIFVVYISLHI
ncbi:NAD-dependent protein deacetylase sirtuin-1-like isoform X1 [Dreissena polymorpha]|uniref:NAD-dependent protein deacetylase sirtuin-1-like isoform X1 n=1 Tax=Dreissena polymorpha TaxID=45954 RepID=UPI002263DB54|nr:NAD-dependent protein deacetylase sirtuin-1-like isoform X1 [Dreissena polymorpha]